MCVENAIDSDSRKYNNTETMNWKHKNHKGGARHNTGLHSKDSPFLLQVGSLRAGQSRGESRPRMIVALFSGR